MSWQTQFAAIEGRGECYWTGANNVVDLDTTAPTGGTSFTAADLPSGAQPNLVKHVDLVAIGGNAYYTNAGTTPDATVGFPAYQDVVAAYRNSRSLILSTKFFVPAGVTLKASWGA